MCFLRCSDDSDTNLALVVRASYNYYSNGLI